MSPATMKISIASLLSLSLCKYDSGMTESWIFCHLTEISVFSATIPNFLQFLSKEFKKEAQRKDDSTWYAKVVIHHISQWSANQEISWELLSKKVAVLLALRTGHQIQTLKAINIQNIEKKNDQIGIKIPTQLRTSCPNRPQPNLILSFFPAQGHQTNFSFHGENHMKPLQVNL